MPMSFRSSAFSTTLSKSPVMDAFDTKGRYCFNRRLIRRSLISSSLKLSKEYSSINNAIVFI